MVCKLMTVAVSKKALFTQSYSCSDLAQGHCLPTPVTGIQCVLVGIHDRKTTVSALE